MLLVLLKNLHRRRYIYATAKREQEQEKHLDPGTADAPGGGAAAAAAEAGDGTKKHSMIRKRHPNSDAAFFVSENNSLFL